MISNQSDPEEPVYAMTFGEHLEVAELDLSGEIGFEINDDMVSIRIDKLRNNGLPRTNASLVLWAHIDQTNDYVVLGTVELGLLESGKIISDLNYTTTYNAPSPGTYAVSLKVLDESTHLASVPFSEVLTISEVSAPKLDLSGSIRYARDGELLMLSVGRIANNGATNSEVTLALSAQPKSGTNINYEIGRVLLGSLPSGEELLNINQETIIYTSPPPGTYTLLLNLLDNDSTADSVILDLNLNIPAIEQLGVISFDITDDVLTLNVGELWNNQQETSALSANLWAVDVSTKAIFLVGELDLGQVSPGVSENLSFTGPYLRPPEGTYQFRLEIVTTENPEQLLYSEEFSGQINVPPLVTEPLLNISGVVSFEIENNSVSLQIDGLSNNDQVLRTPLLQLITTQNSESFVIASFTLAPLDGGKLLVGADETADYHAPPPGTYGLSLNLVDASDHTVIFDSLVFTNELVVAEGQITMSGPFSFELKDIEVTIHVAQIVNSTQTAADLLLHLKATSKVDGQQIILGEVVLNSLSGHSSIDNIVESTELNTPPPGTYNVALELVKQSDQSVIQKITFDEPLIIENNPPAKEPALEISGTVGFGIDNGNVTLQIERLINNDQATRTPLLQLIATQNSESFVIASFTLTPLDGENFLASLSETADYQAPPPGTYSLSLNLADATDSTIILDSLILTNELIVPESIIAMSGPFGLEFDGSEIMIRVAKIINTTPSTVNLLLHLKATSEEDGQQIIIGEITLNALNTHSSIEDFAKSTKFTTPPPGTYNVTLDLFNQFDQTVIQQFAFSEPLTIENTSSDLEPEKDNPSKNAGSNQPVPTKSAETLPVNEESGGGGATGIVLLGFLLIMLVRNRPIKITFCKSNASAKT